MDVNRSQLGLIMTLLVNSRRPISNTIGVRVTRAMCSVSLAFKRHMQDRSSERF
jgi:hypothetical protein